MSCPLIDFVFRNMQLPFLVIATCILLPRNEFVANTLSLSFTLAVQKNIDGPPSYSNLQGIKLALRSLEEAARADCLGPMAVYPDPILRHSVSHVTNFDSKVEKVANLLIDGMKTDATTAIQYGIDARIIVLKGSASPLATGAPLVLINPNVLSRSGEDKMVPWTEYCGVFSHLSGNKDEVLEVELLRDEVVEVAAQDILGIPVRKALQGEAARSFQHELDHLEGLLIIDHAGLDELPIEVARLEAPYHRDRQRLAYERRVYQGNEPLYR